MTTGGSKAGRPSGAPLLCPYDGGMLDTQETYGRDHLWTCGSCTAQWSSSGYPYEIPEGPATYPPGAKSGARMVLHGDGRTQMFNTAGVCVFDTHCSPIQPTGGTYATTAAVGPPGRWTFGTQDAGRDAPT